MLFLPAPDYLRVMDDGTVKQLNPFSGTQVWTVAGRGNRPLQAAAPLATPVTPTDHTSACPFCSARQLETPPEKARLTRLDDGSWETRTDVLADELTTAPAPEFRRLPNLFEILSYDYWRSNYGYELPEAARERQRRYLSTPAGLEHARGVARAKLRAMGLADEEIAAQLEQPAWDELAAGFFGSGHDLIVARRHYTDCATDSTQLASSGTLTPDEHEQFIRFTVAGAKDLYDANRYARYVAVFQNWLRPAGASFDHLHKQLVAIDERGVQHELAIERLRANPNVFNEDAANYAAYANLVIAENDHALAFAGFGHRYPTVEIYSKSAACDPWAHSGDELRGMSDLIHAVHAATGPAIPCNEEWHSRPIDLDLAMPWRVVVKWRVSTLAGFEGATKIYLNTIDPWKLRDRVVSALFELRAAGRIADVRIATECECRPNPLRYGRG